MDFLLDDEKQPGGQAAPAAQPKYDFMLDGEQPASQRATSTLRQAVNLDPEKAAKVKRLADVTGLSPDVVERNTERVEADAKVQQLQGVLAESPILARQLSDPNFAKIAHDDTANLSNVDKLVRLPVQAVKSVAAGVAPSLASGLWGVAAAPFELASQFIGQPLAGKLLPEDPFAKPGAFFRNASKQLEDYSKRVADVPNDAGMIERGMASGFQSLGQNLPAIIAAVTTGNPAAPLSILSAVQGGQSYTKAREAGKTPMQATAFGATDAAIEAVTEVAPWTALIKNVKAGSPFFQTLIKNQVQEQVGEQAATALQDLNEWANLNPDKPFSAYLAERPAAAAQTAIATLVSSGGTVALSKAVEHDLRQSAKAQQAQNSSAAVEQLIKLAEASQVRSRDPASFQRFVDDAASEGPVQQVFVPAQTFAQAAGEKLPEIAAAMPSVAEQIDEAIKSGGDLVIPVGEFAAHIPGTGLEQKLIDHVRTDVDGMSRAEAQAFMQSSAEELQAQSQQIIEQQQFDHAIAQSAETVHNELLTQLNSANRFTPEVNAQYAKLASAFYTVQAARLGITPEQMYVQFPLQITAEGVAGSRQLDQEALAKQVINSQAFKKWFAESKVTDQQGKPLVLYHGTTGDFDAFSSMHKGANTLAFSGKAGFWFTNSPKHSSDFASEKSGGNVMPVYLSLKNPLIVQNVNDEKGRMAAIDQAKRDGVIFKNSEERARSTRATRATCISHSTRRTSRAP
jgi:hypothetical protein